MIRYRTALIAAKGVQGFGRLLGGHGSALPGLVAETICPDFLAITGRHAFTDGVIVVTGTNGKTTTTRLLVGLLRSKGKRVLTNASGSNLSRGIISTFVEHMGFTGAMDADIAVLEIDEAYAPRITEYMHPDAFLALNVLRDQLDRYGEIDTTARLIAKAAKHAKQVFINGDDDLLLKRVKETKDAKHITTVGFASALQTKLVTEASLYGANIDDKKSTISINTAMQGKESQSVSISVEQKKYAFKLPLLGIHNAFNATIAAVAASRVVGDVYAELNDLYKEASPAFGRGETLQVGNHEVTVALVKNPAGFTQNLTTFVKPTLGALCIIINDNYADGRDVSWLWDAQVSKLKTFEGPIFIAGSRKYDMALRLKYEGIKFEVLSDADITTSLKSLFARADWSGHLLIVPTYTAMLTVRKWLGKKLGVKRIW